MTNDNDLAKLIPEPMRTHIEQHAQAITRRVLDEANTRTFDTPQSRARWILDQVRLHVLHPTMAD